VVPGAAVHVAAGAYRGSFDTSTSGSSSAYITYEAASADFSHSVNCAQVAAGHGSLSSCVQLIGASGTTWVNLGNYVAIQGFDVTGPGINGIYTQGNATKIIGNHVHNILTATCNSTGGSGINLNGTNAQVIGNYVHNIGPYPAACGYVQGMYFLQPGGFAFNNVSFANSGFGIQLWHGPSNIELVNNTLFSNASGGIVLGTDDANVTVDYVTVSNNIIYKNGGAGISEQGASARSTGKHNVYANNLVDQNASGDFSFQNGLTATSTVNASPQFINYTGNSAGSYGLLSTSPAIHAGTGSDAPSYDFNDATRSQGEIDIGAYQYASAGAAANGPLIHFLPSVLTFSGTKVGAISAVKYVTVSNAGSSTLTFNGNFSIVGPFAFAGLGTCGSSVAPGSSCSISVHFKPAKTGTVTGVVTIHDNVSSGSHTISLSGTGQ